MKTREQRAAAYQVMVAARVQYEQAMHELEEENAKLRQLVADYQQCIADGNYSRVRVYAPKDVAKLQRRADQLLGIGDGSEKGTT